MSNNVKCFSAAKMKRRSRKSMKFHCFLVRLRFLVLSNQLRVSGGAGSAAAGTGDNILPGDLMFTVHKE